MDEQRLQPDGTSLKSETIPISLSQSRQSTTLGDEGWVTIPQEVLDTLQLQAGDRVEFLPQKRGWFLLRVSYRITPEEIQQRQEAELQRREADQQRREDERRRADPDWWVRCWAEAPFDFWGKDGADMFACVGELLQRRLEENAALPPTSRRRVGLVRAEVEQEGVAMFARVGVTVQKNVMVAAPAPDIPPFDFWGPEGADMFLRIGKLLRRRLAENAALPRTSRRKEAEVRAEVEQEMVAMFACVGVLFLEEDGSDDSPFFGTCRLVAKGTTVLASRRETEQQQREEQARAREADPEVIQANAREQTMGRAAIARLRSIGDPRLASLTDEEAAAASSLVEALALAHEKKPAMLNTEDGSTATRAVDREAELARAKARLTGGRVGDSRQGAGSAPQRSKAALDKVDMLEEAELTGANARLSAHGVDMHGWTTGEIIELYRKISGDRVFRLSASIERLEKVQERENREELANTIQRCKDTLEKLMEREEADLARVTARAKARLAAHRLDTDGWSIGQILRLDREYRAKVTLDKKREREEAVVAMAKARLAAHGVDTDGMGGAAILALNYEYQAKEIRDKKRQREEAEVIRAKARLAAHGVDTEGMRNTAILALDREYWTKASRDKSTPSWLHPGY